MTDVADGVCFPVSNHMRHLLALSALRNRLVSNMYSGGRMVAILIFLADVKGFCLRPAGPYLAQLMPIGPTYGF